MPTVFAHRLHGRGTAEGDLLSMPAGGSRCPASVNRFAAGNALSAMDGKETFKNAVQAMLTRHRVPPAAAKSTSRSRLMRHPASGHLRIIMPSVNGWARSRKSFINLDKNTATPRRLGRHCPRRVVETKLIQQGGFLILLVVSARASPGAPP